MWIVDNEKLWKDYSGICDAMINVSIYRGKHSELRMLTEPNQLPLVWVWLIKVGKDIVCLLAIESHVGIYVGSSLKACTTFVSQMYDLNTLYVYHTY